MCVLICTYYLHNYRVQSARLNQSRHLSFWIGLDFFAFSSCLLIRLVQSFISFFLKLLSSFLITHFPESISISQLLIWTSTPFVLLYSFKPTGSVIWVKKKTFCGFPWVVTSTAGRVYDLCVYYMTGAPEGSPKVLYGSLVFDQI